jgi:hypothetical protein
VTGANNANNGNGSEERLTNLPLSFFTPSKLSVALLLQAQMMSWNNSILSGKCQ